MAKIIRIEEHFQHFLNEVKESFWGDLYGQTFSSVLPWNGKPAPSSYLHKPRDITACILLRYRKTD